MRSDLGQHWSPRANVQVPDCGNKGSVLALDGNLILSTSASCVNRVNLTVFLSKENGKPGSFVYRQRISSSAGYNTLSSIGGKVAVLFEQEWALNPNSSGIPAGSHAVDGAQTITLALLDPNSIPKQGVVPCADSMCHTDHPPPPPALVNSSVGYCRGPPPPPPPPAPDSAAGRACQAMLDAFCNNATANSDCYQTSANISGKSYHLPPYHALYDRATGSDVALGWRCYSHLALAPAPPGSLPPWHWSSNTSTGGHPFCTNPGWLGHGGGALQDICSRCSAPPPGLPGGAPCLKNDDAEQTSTPLVSPGYVGVGPNVSFADALAILALAGLANRDSPTLWLNTTATPLFPSGPRPPTYPDGVSVDVWNPDADAV